MALPPNEEPPGSFPSLDRLGARFFTVQERIGVVFGNRDLSPMLQASELRRAFDELQPVLTDGGLLPAFTASRNATAASSPTRSKT